MHSIADPEQIDVYLIRLKEAFFDSIKFIMLFLW
jgi:hypothetical protein